MSLDEAKEIFDKSCEDDPKVKATPLPRISNTFEPRHRLSIPKRRRIPRPRRPTYAQIARAPKNRSRGRLTAEQLIERQIKVYDLRRDEGKTFSEIGKILGISESCARTDARVVRKARWDGLVDRDDSIIDESNERYDQLISKWLPLALDPEISVEGRNGDKVIALEHWESAKAAGEMILKICRQREQLNGLLDPKSPQKVSLDISPDALGVLEALKRAFSPKVIKAEVVSNELIENSEDG